MRIVVLSTYDILPVVNGGQSRYFNIYSRLSKNHEITIIVYDWRYTERTKKYHIGPQLSVIAPRTLSEDIALNQAAQQRTNRTLHDVHCIRRYRFSPEFHDVLRTTISRADIVIASHPYLASVAFGYCGRGITKIYEAYNVEFDAKTAYFAGSDDPEITDYLLNEVRYSERLALYEANYVTAVSAGDADRFIHLYGVSRSKITVIPNGVDTASYPRPDNNQKQSIRRMINSPAHPVGVFIGSGYKPNVDSYLRIREMLAKAEYSGSVIIIGSIKEGIPKGLGPVSFEERWLGFVNEEIKTILLAAADFALQLIFSGSGTNLKIFEYMAARTLIAGNSFGTRGVPGNDWYWPVENTQDLRRFLDERPWQYPTGFEIIARARAIAERQFDWGVIVSDFERLLTCAKPRAKCAELGSIDIDIDKCLNMSTQLAAKNA